MAILVPPGSRREMRVTASPSRRHGRSWPAILVLPVSREVVDGHSHSPVSREVVYDHPCPPSVTGDCRRPSSSSQCQGRTWTVIVVLPTSRQVVDSHRRPPDVTGGRGRPSSFSQHHGLVLLASWQVILVLQASHHPRHPSVATSSSPCHGRSCRPSLSSQHRGLAASSATLFSWRHRSKSRHHHCHEVRFVVIFNVQISSVNYSPYPTLFLPILQ